MRFASVPGGRRPSACKGSGRHRDAVRDRRFTEQSVRNVVRLPTTSVTKQEQYWKGSFPLKSSLLEHALSLSGDLREAYEAPMEFRAILEEPSYSVQRVMLTGWLTVYTASAHESTRRCANTIRHYRSYIQNSWKLSVSPDTIRSVISSMFAARTGRSGLPQRA